MPTPSASARRGSDASISGAVSAARATTAAPRPLPEPSGSLDDDVDPEAFAGHQAFIDQMDFVAERCHANAPLDPDRPVRLPGEQANRNIAEATAKGVQVSAETAAALRAWADRLGVSAAPLAPSRQAMPAS